MTTLKILIVDDELIARARLERLLSALPEVAIAGQCSDADSALARVKEGDIDVLLLDIHMPGLTGLDVAQLLPDGRPAVVFVTAHADHAVDAFSLGAADYLLKPVDAVRLQRALERVRGRAPRAPSPQDALLPRLAIPTRKGVVLVDPVDVTHATLENDLVTVFVRGAQAGAYITDFSVGDLEERLPVDRFVRVHRKALLNLAAVARLDPVETGGYVARVAGDGSRGAGDHDVIVSRAAARELRRRLGLRDP